MEKLSPHILARLREGQRQRNLRLLIQYMAVVFGIILVYTATFQA